MNDASPSRNARVLGHAEPRAEAHTGAPVLSLARLSVGHCAALVSLDGHFLTAPPRIQSIFRRDDADLIGRRFQDLTHPDDLLRDTAHLERLLESGQGSYSMLKRYLDPDGRCVWAELSVELVTDEGGKPSHFVSAIQKVNLNPNALDPLLHQAMRDALTGLLNRATMLEQIDTWTRHAARLSTGFGLLVLDLNGFKKINDDKGHSVGDMALMQVANRLLQALPASDLVGRFGGDEFVALLCDPGGPMGLLGKQARVEAALKRPVTLLDEAVTVSASIGLARFPEHAMTATDLLRYANTEMYARKGRVIAPTRHEAT